MRAAGTPTFTIVIATRDRPERLVTCLRALAELDYEPSGFEVIVVDDGSRRPPRDVIAACGDKAAGNGAGELPAPTRLDVRLLVQPHAGPAAARNRGAAEARGRYLAFTDDDCMPAIDWLRVLERHFAPAPRALIGGRTVNGIPANPYSTASQLLIDYLHRYYNADADEARFLTSSNLAVAAQTFRDLGGFDSRFPRAAAEDRELTDRARSFGHRVLYAPEAVVHHAHRLTLRTFWLQHFEYGRGACRFHRVRSPKGLRAIRPEPLAFYRGLLQEPLRERTSLDREAVTGGEWASGDAFEEGEGPVALRGVGSAEALRLGALLALSQVANAAGFAWAVLTSGRAGVAGHSGGAHIQSSSASER